MGAIKDYVINRYDRYGVSYTEPLGVSPSFMDRLSAAVEEMRSWYASRCRQGTRPTRQEVLTMAQNKAERLDVAEAKIMQHFRRRRNRKR